MSAGLTDELSASKLRAAGLSEELLAARERAAAEMGEAEGQLRRMRSLLRVEGKEGLAAASHCRLRIGELASVHRAMEAALKGMEV